MRNVSFGVALAVSALMIGCQDGSNNNPVGSALTPSIAKTASIPPRINPDGVITLKHIIAKENSPSLSDFYSVEGTVSYTLVETGSPDVYTLSLVIDATVQSLSNEKAESKAYFEMIEDMTISEKDGVDVLQAISLSDSSNPLRLSCEFHVSRDYVELTGISIADDLTDRR